VKLKRFNSIPFILLSLLFGCAFIHADYLMDGWQTGKLFYFYAVSTGIIAFFSISFFFRKDRYNLKLNRIDLFVILFTAYCFFQVLFTDTVYLSNAKIITLILLTLLYFIWKNRFKSEKLLSTGPYIILIAFVGAGLFQSAYGLGQLYGIFPVRPGSWFTLTGSFVNPDHFAGFVASILPFAFGLYYLNRGKKHSFGLLPIMAACMVVLSLLVLPATTIRGSWLAAAGGVLVIMACKHDWFSVIKSVTNTKFKQTGALIAIVLILAPIGFGLYAMKPDSAYGRLFIWQVALETVKENPFLGNGFDSYKTEHNNAQALFFASGDASDRQIMAAGNVEHAHNEYLQILSEIGIIGLLIFLGIVVSALQVKSEKPGTSTDAPDLHSRDVIRITAKAALMSLLILALFTFPFHILPTYINFFFILALLSPLDQSEKDFSLRIPAAAGKGIAIIGILVAVLLAKHTWSQYQAHKTWETAFALSRAQLFEPAIRTYESAYPDLKHNGKFLFTYGGVLTAAERFDEALPLLERSKQYYSNPSLFMALGQTYENLKEFEKAKLHYRHASNIMPHRLYPLYRLVRLKEKAGEQENAVQLASQIIRMEEKVPTTAAREIKEEMSDFINNSQPEASQ